MHMHMHMHMQCSAHAVLLHRVDPLECRAHDRVHTVAPEDEAAPVDRVRVGLRVRVGVGVRVRVRDEAAPQRLLLRAGAGAEDADLDLQHRMRFVEPRLGHVTCRGVVGLG